MFTQINNVKVLYLVKKLFFQDEIRIHHALDSYEISRFYIDWITLENISKQRINQKRSAVVLMQTNISLILANIITL